MLLSPFMVPLAVAWITFVQYLLPTDPDLAPYMEQIQLVDGQNRLIYRPAGCHEIQPDPAMSYVGFMPVGQGRLEITGAKYPLHQENYF